MAVSQDVVEMEGMLYLVRHNRIGLQYYRKRYFVLRHDDHLILNTFKSPWHYSMDKDPIRSIAINSSTRVTENWRESIQRKAFFVFILYNTSNHDDHMKLGANSPEEAAKWIQSLQEAALKVDMSPGNVVDCPKLEWQYLRLNFSGIVHSTTSLDQASCSASPAKPMTDDIIAPSTWTIIGCHNGLRLFKEAKDRGHPGKSLGDYPAIMAMGLVDETAEAIFETFMSLGSTRSEWDFCFDRGTVIEHIDYHTDLIHEQLHGDWLPWGMKRRDLLMHRYWRREEDGTYVILYQSVLHKKCPPQKGSVRACLKGGGYVIYPVNQGTQSVVKKMLAIDWRYWKPYRQASSAQSITIRMLGRLAALRELFSTKPGRYSSSEFMSRELMSDRMLHRSGKAVIVEAQKIAENEEIEYIEDDVAESPDYHSCRIRMDDDDDADELFHASEPLDHDKLTVLQKRGYTELIDMERYEGVSCTYGTTLPKDHTRNNLPHSWSAADPSMFQTRGKTYLQDRKKITAQGTLMQMVGMDWLRSDKREDDLAGRPGSIVQKFAANGRPEFFFVVNMQIPGYSLAYYHMMSDPLDDTPLLESFINGDDTYRNSRFKLISSMSKAPWIIKQSIGKKPCLLGQKQPIKYVRGHNYLELDIDVGESAIARSLSSMVLSYFSNVITETAFLLQGNTEEELPEFLIGAFQLNHLDITKAVCLGP